MMCPPPTDQQRASPEEQFKKRSRKADPKPLPFLGEQPNVTHVAIKGRLEIHEQKAQFMHLAAEMFAGQPVGEFVQDATRETLVAAPARKAFGVAVSVQAGLVIAIPDTV